MHTRGVSHSLETVRVGSRCGGVSGVDPVPSAGETPYKVDAAQLGQRAKLLQKYLSDEQKELQALYALQALLVEMEQPASE